MKAKLFTLIMLVAACSQDHSGDRKPKTEMDSLTSIKPPSRMIKPEQLKTGEGFSTPVLSDAQKFIIPVPAFANGGEPLIYPKNDPKAGTAIVDYEGKPIGKNGIVFFNYKDKSLQAAAGDGNAVIIINEVKHEQAEKLDAEIKKHQSDPNNLSLEELKEILIFCHEKLQLSDMYNSTKSFIKEKMTAVLADDRIKGKDEAYGFKKRDDRDINQAIYIPGAFVFQGPAASHQQFENGGIIIESGGKMRGIQPEIFLRTYKLANGKDITSVGEIKSQNP